MNKNIIIGVLVLIIVLETGYLFVSKKSLNTQNTANPNTQNRMNTVRSLPPAGPNAKGNGPIILSKGMNLKNTPLFRYAYQIAPGTLSSSAEAAMVGWNIVTKTQNDGSVTVTLTPKDSKDQNQQYTVRQGQTLYFIEQTKFDDNPTADQDLNYRDDYGIIVDQNGIIQ